MKIVCCNQGFTLNGEQLSLLKAEEIFNSGEADWSQNLGKYYSLLGKQDIKGYGDLMELNKGEYKELRERLGNQEQVASMLGVRRETLIRRESGANKISREMSMSLHYLADNERLCSRLLLEHLVKSLIREKRDLDTIEKVIESLRSQPMFEQRIEVSLRTLEIYEVITICLDAPEGKKSHEREI